MLCYGKPQDPSKYYLTADKQVIFFLMKHDIQPLYNDGKIFYFTRSDKLDECLVEYRKSLRKEGAEIGTETM